jgi:phage terminase large subunit
MPPGRPRKVLLTLEGVFLEEARARLEATRKTQFPNAKYRDDPEGFCTEVLGVEPWWRQVEVLDAVKSHKRVAVRSGHKIGKSRAAAMLALWFYCSYEDARVVMTSTTDRQVNAILWREVRKVHAGSGVCLACKRARYKGPKPCPHSAVIDGVVGDLARTGLKAADFREITGYTAKEPEAIAGVSGGNILYIVDEASGVPDKIFEAIEGNRAGGARIVMFSNPTKNQGKFYDAFYTEEGWVRITVSSLEVAAHYEAQGQQPPPGMAGREWCEEKGRDWGTDSPLYKVRVLGEHAIKEEGRIFSLHAIGEAEARRDEWEESGAEAEGPLQLGLDPAGPTGSGDESAFCLRRGNVELYKLETQRLTEEGHLVEVLRILSQYKREGEEAPIVCMDRGGKVGSEVFGYLSSHEAAHPEAFRLVSVRASDQAQREPHVYDRMRDCLTANLEAWVRGGGCLFADDKRTKEMHIMEWEEKAGDGRYKVTHKDHIRKVLGRSPDRYDALTLAVWVPAWLKDAPPAPPPAALPPPEPTREGDPLDPYAGARAFR